MSRYHSHISSAVKIINAYHGAEPLVHFLKKFFAANKKYGSRDRKTIAGLCYDYFRAAHALKDRSMEEKILHAFFLCETAANPLLELFHPELNEKIGLPAKEKSAIIGINASDLFRFRDELSGDIDGDAFSLSFLQQPDLFLRARPHKKASVASKLTRAGIEFEAMDDNCIAIKNATSLDAVIQLNKEAVVQDRNSQKVFDYTGIQQLDATKAAKIHVWDCCAASGGKSILLYDKLAGNVELTVSDIRENILANLRKRLQEARVEIYKWFVADLVKTAPGETGDLFGIIICDAPCTGSGTWGRTPEQLAFFKRALISTYADKQKRIASNALRQLQPGGLFFYITCSVFKKENEDVVDYLSKQFKLKILQQELLTGYDQKADSMFVAVLGN